MTNGFDVPAEMREFAALGVAQARKAFESFMGAVHSSSAMVDTSSIPAMGGVKDISTKTAGYVEKNMHAAFDLADRLVRAKDLTEALALQSDFAKAQMAAAQEQAREIGAAMSKAVPTKQ